jgi:O-antigen biosynthesis protein
VLFAPRELPPLPPDVSQDPSAYAAWVRRREAERSGRAHRTRGAPRSPLVLVMLVGDAPAASVARSLRGLRAQTNPRWFLTLVASAPRRAELEPLVRSGLPRRARHRLRWVLAAPGTPLPELLRQGLRSQADAPAALLFPGDVWAPDAVALLGGAVSPEGVVYADEDTQRDGGAPELPRLKPDYSPEFLRSTGYVGRPLAIGSALLREVGAYAATDPSGLEHQCAIDVCGRATSVIHLPEVLCHRDATADMTVGAMTAQHGRAATRRHDAVAVPAASSTPPSVSILVPFRDEPQLLRVCVDSVTATTGDCDVEFVLIDNGSSDPETLTLVERLSDRSDVRVLRDQRPFNWAALNNAGARVARGDLLLFLNNDIEAQRPGWLGALCAHAVRSDVAAVGARLLYPDRRLQHCGIVVGMTGAAGHPLLGLAEDDPGYLGLATETRECSAVTGACLTTRREVFEQLEGFDETLGVDLNDVDYCLRAMTNGYRTLYEPRAELIHHESPSRGTAGGVCDIVRFLDRWKGYIARGDRYFNAHLTRTDQSCGLAGDDEEEAWNQWYVTVTKT